MERFYQTHEVAKLLGLARETVYRKVKSGEIPAIRIGGGLRFPASLLGKWLESKGKERSDRWRSHLKRFVELLRQTWDDDLKSVILFGSFAANKESPQSDMDLLIVCGAFPKSRLERQGLLFDLAKKISPAFAHKLSPVALTPDEAMEPRPLYLGFLTAHESLWDPDRFFEDRLEWVRKELEKSGAVQQVDAHGLPYWIFPAA